MAVTAVPRPNATSSSCDSWTPLLPELPHAALWANLGLYSALLLLVAVLLVASCCPRGAPIFRRRPVTSSLVVAFAACRVVWATYIIAVLVRAKRMRDHGDDYFSMQERRTAFFLECLGTIFFFAITGLLLVDMADALVVGWKSSRRLWAAFKVLVVVLVLTAFACGLMTFNELSLAKLVELSDDTVATACVCVALAILVLSVRYYTLHDPPAILSRFYHVRRAIDAVIAFVIFCFLFRAVPTRLVMMAIAALRLCPTSGGSGYLGWLIFVQARAPSLSTAPCLHIHPCLSTLGALPPPAWAHAHAPPPHTPLPLHSPPSAPPPAEPPSFRAAFRAEPLARRARAEPRAAAARRPARTPQAAALPARIAVRS